MHQRRLLTVFLKDQPRGKFYLMVFISALGSENESFFKRNVLVRNLGKVLHWTRDQVLGEKNQRI